jgi:hypothetical protein
MPLFNASPFSHNTIQRLTPGRPNYLFGAWNDKTSPTKLQITSVQATTGTATLGVVVVDGNIPAVGSLLTVYGTATNSQFNVTNAVLSAVSITASTGVGTVSWTGAFSAVSQTNDAGVGLIPQPETSDSFSASVQSVAVAAPDTKPWSPDGIADTVQCEVNFPTLPTACVVSLQGCLYLDPAGANFQTAIANVVTVAASAATYGTLSYTGKFAFYRYGISGVSGSGTIVGKLHL